MPRIKIPHELIIVGFGGLLLTACQRSSPAFDTIHKSGRTQAGAEPAQTNWTPTWNTGADKNREAKTRLVATIAFANDGFHGSPVFNDPEQKRKNTEARSFFALSLRNVPECSGITLEAGNSQGADFALQLFSGIDGRTGRLQWVLYRTDTLGEVAYGEGTGAETRMGQEGIAEAICSVISQVTMPEKERRAHQVSNQEIQPSLEAWEDQSKALEASFAHFHYRLPGRFHALSDLTRRKENRARYEMQISDALKKQTPNREAEKSNDGKHSSKTYSTGIITPYTLMVAARAVPATIDTDQMPRVDIYALKRFGLLMEANDPAKMVMYVPGTKVLRGPEDVLLSDRKFVRADFQFASGDFLSKFCIADGDYLFEFDFRAANEKDLGDLVNSMQSLLREKDGRLREKPQSR